MLLLSAAATVQAQDFVDYSGCKATVDLKSFDDKIRVTHQAAPETLVDGVNLEFVLVDQDGNKLGDAVALTLGINHSVTISVKEVFVQANAPKPWKLNNKYIYIIELQGNIEHDMQGTVTYFNGVVPLIFTCVLPYR